MRCRNLLAWVAAAVAAVSLGCGGGGPSSPSGTGVEVHGVVLSGAAAVVASSGSHPAAKAQKVTVTVEGTTITAEVGADGTFVLKGVPSGDFTLVFMVDGVKIGEVPISAPAGSDVKITVKVEASHVVLVTIKIEAPDGSEAPSACVISGGQKGQGIELEGSVSSGSWELFNMTVNGGRAGGLATVTSGASTTYRCIGGAKTPTVDECKALVAKGGAKVHVRGTLTDCTTTVAQVAASEVKIQK
jgi:hypothetical protein